MNRHRSIEATLLTPGEWDVDNDRHTAPRVVRRNKSRDADEIAVCTTIGNAKAIAALPTMVRTLRMLLRDADTLSPSDIKACARKALACGSVEEA